MDLLSQILTRRSTAIKDITGPGPSAEQIDTILKAASRVPDHNRLAPWWFITFEGAARAEFGEVLRMACQEKDPDAGLAKLELEAGRFMRAPLVIAVISRIKQGKAPQWEQILSAGAACYNLCLAANALGFATNWVTEWYAYDPAVRQALGLDERDTIAGFVYIGTQGLKPEERERPELSALVNRWTEGYSPKKGDEYGKGDMGLPGAGFELPQ